MVEVFKNIIDMNFIAIDNVYNLTFIYNGTVIVVGELICGCIIAFELIRAIFEVLGIAKNITKEE